VNLGLLVCQFRLLADVIKEAAPQWRGCRLNKRIPSSYMISMARSTYKILRRLRLVLQTFGFEHRSATTDSSAANVILNLAIPMPIKHTQDALSIV
jgi:hypothetical protein